MNARALLDKVRAHDYRVGVIGLGRVGLPLALSFARKGIHVVGVDRDPRLLALVEGGHMPFEEAGGQQALDEALAAGTFSVTGNYAELETVDAMFITVATGLNTEMRVDYAQVQAVLEVVCPHLRPVQLMMMRSTVSPGTLEKVVKPYIEAHTDLEVGSDILLASTPERIAAGRAIIELETLPEIVGGNNDIATEIAAEVMLTLNPAKEIHRTDPVSAELAKLFTNVYRYVTFAVSNEFALLSEYHGRDAYEIINMINGGYTRGGIPSPGPCGGPCLAKDGYLLVDELSFPDFILTAWKLNEGIPAHLVNRLKQTLRGMGKDLAGARVGVLGMGFKADVDDLRQSPALRIIEILKREGADVLVHDPFHNTAPLDDVIAGAQAVVLATNHTAYRTLSPSEMIARTREDCVFVDCWGQWTDAGDAARLITLGVGDPA